MTRMCLGFRNNEFFHDSIDSKMLGSQTKEVDNYILMHMAQGVGKSTLRIILGVKLFTRGI